MVFGAKFFVLFLISGSCAEPICSKFAYEEQLLEKMVRTEFNVEKMDKNMKETSNLVQNYLQQLRANWSQISKEFQEKKEALQAIIDINKAKVTKELDKMQKEREKTIAEYDARITKCEGAVLTPNIAFRARSPSLLDPVENQVIVFTKDIFNIGNAYDNSTGVFTAPLNGTYLLTSQLCLQNRKTITFGIFVEDGMYTVGTFCQYRNDNCFSVETTVVMEALRKATVRSWSATSGEVLKENESHFWSMFSGTLIHK
ncbi:uncharacterized protein LOC123545381 [Mercenaria mercenaria]|uniref:uncharacterized protein LOC123545381 n=1 Tax=Mercenaria mercenaria TaxID=6596 RepID=UPI00234ED0DD|nr:uncharacterized protein LOC123545381 [Mercenaria mercenaria]